jgi:phosphate starvation-inducible protein PhoH
MVVTGDLRQADRLEDNGLIDFTERLANKQLDMLSVVQFGMKDIERHEAVKEVLSIYGD